MTNKRKIPLHEIDPEVARKRRKNASLLRTYGITLDQYDELLAKQAGNCALCDRPKTDFKVSLAVDHNHITGEIRGLLCAYCNHRVIGRHRDGELLRKMAMYVDQGTGLFVPKRPPRKRKRTKCKSKK